MLKWVHEITTVKYLLYGRLLVASALNGISKVIVHRSGDDCTSTSTNMTSEVSANIKLNTRVWEQMMNGGTFICQNIQHGNMTTISAWWLKKNGETIGLIWKLIWTNPYRDWIHDYRYDVIQAILGSPDQSTGVLMWYSSVISGWKATGRNYAAFSHSCSGWGGWPVTWIWAHTRCWSAAQVLLLSSLWFLTHVSCGL